MMDGYENDNSHAQHELNMKKYMYSATVTLHWWLAIKTIHCYIP